VLMSKETLPMLRVSQVRLSGAHHFMQEVGCGGHAAARCCKPEGHIAAHHYTQEVGREWHTAAREW